MTTQSLRRAATVLGLGSLLLAVPFTAGAATPTELSGSAPAGASALGTNPAGAPETDPTTEPQVLVRIQQVMSNLDHPWDVAFTPDNTMLVTERDRERIIVALPSGHQQVMLDSPAGIWHSGETGLMGIEVDPDFDENRFIYTCHGSDAGRGIDIRVVQWQVAAGFTSATEVKTIVKGMPVTSGRHGGCRLRFAPNGALYIGTGDAATGTNPQDLSSLGGKVLRVNTAGRPFRGNPFSDAEDINTRRIYTYGHRNVQGLAYRTGADIEPGMWSVEQGTDRDDEVNQLKAGGNAGYNPVPGYNEAVPMTDFDLDGDVFAAKWSSGFPTLATSGATWLTHRQWGPWQGRLAVAALKDESLQLMRFGPNGGLLNVTDIPDLDDNFGRLRTAQTGPGGAMFITTDNGGGNDEVLKVTVR